MIKRILIKALTFLARCAVVRYKPRIFVVTGSVGKTSTKDALYALLNDSGTVRASEKSFNSDIGVPLTIVGASNPWKNPLRWIHVLAQGVALCVFPCRYPSTLVLEVGADMPGDMDELLSWLPVDSVVVTRIPDMPPHRENYPSYEALVAEELKPVSRVPKGGSVVVSVHNPVYERVRAMTHARVIPVGSDAGVQVRDSSIVYADGVPAGSSFSLSYQHGTVDVSLPGVLGAPHAEAVAHAAAAALAWGVPLSRIPEALSRYVPPKGRMRLIEGVEHSTIIDDSYNANPRAAEAALATLKELRAKRKIACLGDMLELGDVSQEGHVLVGRLAARSADVLVTVGERACAIAEGARDMGMSDEAIYSYTSSKEAAEKVKSFVKEGDVVLVKGSAGMRMERLVVALMKHPERAPVETVRQEKEWKKRS